MWDIMDKSSTTETAFLDAAEQLFAEFGFEGTRVRAIAEASKANLGALHYYWGSKDALFAAVWKRRMQPLVEARRKYIDEILEQAGDAAPDIGDLVAMWIEAGLGLGMDEKPNEAFQRLYGRALTDPSPAVREVVGQYLDDTGRQLVALIRRACPDLDDTSIYWRMHGLLGAVLYAHVGRERLDRIAVDLEPDRDLANGARHLIQFVTSGFRNPPLAD